MDHVQVNLWGVLLAGVSSMVIGMLYYADAVFGKEWKQLAKINKKQFDKDMPRVMPALFLAALVTAFVVAYFTFLYHNFFLGSWVTAGALTALSLWLGIAVTTVSIHNSLEQRPMRLTYIALGNRLLSLLAIGLIVGWLHP
jgi:hypothetical protein